MPTTQDGRRLAISTPLGKDFLLIESLEGTEGISELFQFEVVLLHEENEPGLKPTYIDPASIIGQGVSIGVLQRDDNERQINGIVSRFSQGRRTERFSYYSATIVPHIWVLTQKAQSRIYQQMTVQDIVKEVFGGFKVKWSITGDQRKREYCVQYRESDFDFASRLMEEEGMYYYFEHENASHTMVITNSVQTLKDCPGKNVLPYDLKIGSEEDFISRVDSWVSDYSLRTGRVSMRDFNFQLPTRKLEASENSVFSAGQNTDLEVYDYPGGYARKYDRIDKSGGPQEAELFSVEADKSETVKRSIEALDAQCNVVAGTSDCASLTSGYTFSLTDHPESSFDGKYLLTRILHEARQSPDYISDEEIEAPPYRNEFTCISRKAGTPPYRPIRKTHKPRIDGSQTAFVVGPAGEEIFTDPYGRIKVQFHWDRHGQVDLASSCWVRVAQMWAGNKFGTIFIPRIGMEVVVDFLEGDPDRPLVTGCVYNPGAMPPYTLPDEKTKSSIKSDSSKGGGGFNEIRFEDKKGSEQIFIHAEKNKDVRIKNDSFEFIGAERHLIVTKSQYEEVKIDKHLKVSGDRNEKVEGGISVNAGMDIDTKAGLKFAVDAGSEVHLKSGTTMTLETGTSLTLKVGGNFININAAGIFIKGTMVMLNSGGAAGSGSGSSPDPPKAPKEADKAEPGSRPPVPPSQAPPSRPTFTTAAAIALVRAAQNGSPFCEICGE